MLALLTDSHMKEGGQIYNIAKKLYSHLTAILTEACFAQVLESWKLLLIEQCWWVTFNVSHLV